MMTNMLSAINKNKLESALLQQLPVNEAAGANNLPWGHCLKDGRLLREFDVEGVGSIIVPISSEVKLQIFVDQYFTIFTGILTKCSLIVYCRIFRN